MKELIAAGVLAISAVFTTEPNNFVESATNPYSNQNSNTQNGCPNPLAGLNRQIVFDAVIPNEISLADPGHTIRGKNLPKNLV